MYLETSRVSGGLAAASRPISNENPPTRRKSDTMTNENETTKLFISSPH